MNVQRRHALFAAATLLLQGGAPGVAAARAEGAAVPTEVADALPGAKLQGQGGLRFLGLRIYDARLWSGAQPVGADWADVPFALELQYARDLTGSKIAERSLVEMKRQGEFDAATASRWLQLLERLIPDVREGDRITGINLPGQGARFCLNGQWRGDARAPVFARMFFGIWLAPQTSEPDLRRALLGRGAS